MDADGNDAAPEWGYCRHPDGCREDALPLWLAGDFPDEPDLRLCQKHIGLHIARLEDLLGTTAAHRSALLMICEMVLKDYEAAYIVLAGDMTQERIDCETRIAAIKNVIASCQLDQQASDPTRLVLRALWSAATAITEGEDTGDAECRYCHADEYPADEQGTEVGWEDEAATQYCINHEPWCPSFLIDRAFDGLGDALVAQVLEGLSTERPDEEQAG